MTGLVVNGRASGDWCWLDGGEGAATGDWRRGDIGGGEGVRG